MKQFVVEQPKTALYWNADSGSFVHFANATKYTTNPPEYGDVLELSPDGFPENHIVKSLDIGSEKFHIHVCFNNSATPADAIYFIVTDNDGDEICSEWSIEKCEQLIKENPDWFK